MGATIRKLENNLITLGTGTMIFGVWTFIKLAFSYIFLGTLNFDESFSESERIATLITLWTFISIDLLLRCYAGLSARAHGKGKKKRLTYVIATGLILSYSIIMLILEIVMLFFSTGTLTIFVSIIIDSSSLVLLMDLFVSSIRLRVLKKKLASENGGEV